MNNSQTETPKEDPQPIKPKKPKKQKTEEDIERQNIAKALYMKTYIREYYQKNKDTFYREYIPSDGTKPLGRRKSENPKPTVVEQVPSRQILCPHCDCVYASSNHRHTKSLKCKYARLLKEQEAQS